MGVPGEFSRICYNSKSFCTMSNWNIRHPGVWTAACLLTLALPAGAFAQKPPLGEVARKEEARRKAAQGSEKVLTNKDLPPAPPKPEPPAGGEAPGFPEQKPAEAAKPETPPPGQDEQKDEAWWRERITRARDGLRRSESFLEALQTRVNVLSADFVNRDDPYQRAKIGEDRQKALAEMERVSADILSFKKQIEDIEEEARKAGVPPGWLR